jgi:DNA-binding NarL/FixJ family response regulator
MTEFITHATEAPILWSDIHATPLFIDTSEHIDEGRSLRLEALAQDARTALETELATVWRDLARGHYRVVDAFFCTERCYLALTPSRPTALAPLEGRRLEILEQILCGTGQKNIALDLMLAPSTVALNARLGLEWMGVSTRPSRVHPLLLLSARAGRDHDATLLARGSSFEHGGLNIHLFSVDRPDHRLKCLLPPAELAVIRGLVEGDAYTAIAARRGTSTRTIANQITAVFRRLRVSGRNDLLQRLFEMQERQTGAALNSRSA